MPNQLMDPTVTHMHPNYWTLERIGRFMAELERLAYHAERERTRDLARLFLRKSTEYTIRLRPHYPLLSLPALYRIWLIQQEIGNFAAWTAVKAEMQALD